MAKQFAGFTPEQLGKIVPEMAGMQADEQKRFLAANPAAASRVGMMSEKAQMALNKGGYINQGYAVGGNVSGLMNNLVQRQIDMFNRNAQNTQVPVTAVSQAVQQPMATGDTLDSTLQANATEGQRRAQQEREAFIGNQMQSYFASDTAKQLNQAQNDAEQRILKETLQRYGLNDGSQVRSLTPEQQQAFGNEFNTAVNNSPERMAAQQAIIDAEKYAQNASGMSNPIPRTDQVQNANNAGAALRNIFGFGGQTQQAQPADQQYQLATTEMPQGTNTTQGTEVPQGVDMQAAAQQRLNDPTSAITPTSVARTPVSENQLIDPTTGQLTGPAPTVNPADVARSQDVSVPGQTQTPQVTPKTVTSDVRSAVDGMPTATGTVSTTVEGQQGTLSEGATAPTDMTVSPDRIREAEAGTRTVGDQELISGAEFGEMPAADAAKFEGEIPSTEAAKFNGETPQANPQDYYNLTPTQIASMSTTEVQDAAKADYYPTPEAAASDYQSMVEGAQGTVGAGELVNAKDITKTAEAVQAVAATMDVVNEQAVAKAAQGSFNQTMLAQAAQGSVPAQATVAGQMENLMQQFNNGTPAWAAGAMRAANAAMAARGIGGSSMAAAAIVQASMEAALPIAQADAQAFQTMNLQNLNNRQQVSLANAAAQQGLELQNLNNKQQVALQNSANAFDLQKTNLSNQQAVVLANAQLKAGLQEQVLGIDTQIALTNAAKYAEKNNINLNNSQQAMLQRSSENLQVEMANLSNQQQASLSALQVKAALMGQELTNEQQMAVLESTQTFEAAKFDASSKQQAFLQDAAAQAALEGKALDARQQTQLFNVSSILEERKIELTNEQQTRIFNTTNRMTVDMEELSNRQQTALANVQIEATLRGQELNNKQQAAVLNAEKFAEANNLTFSTEAQMQLANSQMMQTIGLAELDSRSAAALQNAATIAAMDTTNLNNRQQAQVENARNFLQMDMANLNNEQQTTMFKMQSVVNSMLSDQAADNAAQQFNASSQMQTDQFFANLTSTIGMFNSEQNNKMNMFEAGEANALGKFNSELINMRDQFNATNSLVIEQANTQWYQTIATADTAAINEANRLDAAAANNMSNLAFSALMQETRDLLSYAWQTENNDADRATQLAIAKISSDDAKAAAAASKKNAFWSAVGNFAAAVVRGS